MVTTIPHWWMPAIGSVLVQSCTVPGRNFVFFVELHKSDELVNGADCSRFPKYPMVMWDANSAAN